jgi:hypothetical protein
MTLRYLGRTALGLLVGSRRPYWRPARSTA